MTLPEHAICSVMLAQFGVRQRFGTKGVVVVTLAGIAPDVDVAAKLYSDDAFWRLHHALGHSLPAILVLSLLVALFGRFALGMQPFRLLWSWCLLAGLVHVATDCLYWYAVKPLWPISDWAVAFEVLEYLDLFVLTVWLAGAICLLRMKNHGVCVARWTFALFGGYVAVRIVLPEPTGAMALITGKWMYAFEQGTPVLDWW